MSAPKYCPDPDHCTYSDCPTAFCDRDGSTHSLQRPCSAATVEQLVAALDGLIQECEYSASSGLPFNFPDGKGQWTQLGNAKALLTTLRQNGTTPDMRDFLAEVQKDAYEQGVKDANKISSGSTARLGNRQSA